MTIYCVIVIVLFRMYVRDNRLLINSHNLYETGARLRFIIVINCTYKATVGYRNK